MATAVITINSTPGPSLNLPINTLVTLDTTTTGSTYLWSILSQPAGTPVSIAAPTHKTTSFTPTKEGSYLIKLVVDAGPSQSVGQAVAAVLELQTGNRIPAVGETTEASSTDGWGTYAVDEILQRVTRFTDAGVVSGKAGEALTAGTPVYASGSSTIAAGLPDARPCLVFKHSFATDPAKVEGNLCVALSNASAGDVIRVLAYGLVQGVPVSGAPTVGAPLYVSDLGTFDLSPGTNPRSVATVVAVGSGTVDLFFGGEQAMPFGTAVGDLTGLYPGPTVAKIQGRTVDTAAPSVGQVLGWDGAKWTPISNSASPTGSASGDLSGTYPGPTVAKLQGHAVDSSAPSSGNLLYWDSSKWALGTLSSLNWSAVAPSTAISIKAPSGTFGYDLTISSGDSNAPVVGGGGTTTVTTGHGKGLGSQGGALRLTTANETDIGIQSGSITLDVGTATSGVYGVVDVGVVSAAYVRIGRVGKEVTNYGIDVGNAVTYTPVAGTTIPVTSPVILLDPGAPVTVAATPSLQTNGISAGTRVILIGKTTGTTLQRENLLAGSKLRLGANTRDVDQYHVLQLVFDGTNWCEVAFANNS